MLTRVALQNFKALHSVSIELDRFTVLVGANGSGKTSVLEAIDLVCSLRERQPDEGSYTFGRPGLVLTGKFAPDRIRCASHPDQGTGIALYTPQPIQVETHRFTVNGEEDFWFRVATAGQYAEFGGPPSPRPAQDHRGPVLARLSADLPRSTRLRLDPERLATPSSIDPGTRPTMSPDGHGLASVLSYLAGLRSGALDRIEADLRGVVPRAETLRIEPEKVSRTEVEYIEVNREMIPKYLQRSYAGHRLEVSMRGMGFLRAEDLSEGTLLTLGILTAIHAGPDPSLVLLDDVDRALHPAAQKALFECLRRLIGLRPELQIVCTTHSPYALDSFAPEEVRVLKLDPAGHAHCKPLSEHPDWNRWRGKLAAGEFWSSVGEDWVYGEEPDAG